MANYVELDGDWVRRCPFKLTQVEMWIYVLLGDKVKLQALCDACINNVQTTNSTTHVTPIATTFGPPGMKDSVVLAVVAEIKRGFSKDAPDVNLGFIKERDIGFFVPVTRTFNGVNRTAALVPYLWVDNLSGMVAGREIYGFPKQLAKMSFHPNNLDFKAKSLGLRQKNNNELAADYNVVHVQAAAASQININFGAGAAELAKATTAIVTAIFSNPLVGWTLPAGGASFDEMPLVFLKQFRDTVNPALACHQSIVQAVLPMQNFNRGGGVLGLTWMQFGKLAYPEIPGTLGLHPLGGPQSNPNYPAIAAFYLEFDFELPKGTQLWP